jgi:predicted PurR-regulated permease PerM
MPPEGGTLQEILRLTRENNKMLHAMRRSAFIGGIFKFIFYIVIFIIIPAWLYVMYLAPVMQQMLSTMNQIQSTGNQAQTQMLSWQKMLQNVESKIPGFSSLSSTSSSSTKPR